MQLLESGEMYLESIYVLCRERAHVRAVDVSEYMGFSKPSVSRALGILKRGGFVTVDEDGYLSLTEIGEEFAEKIYDRHTVLTGLLTAIGVSESVAAEDACRIEHHISDESLAAIKKYYEKIKK